MSNKMSEKRDKFKVLAERRTNAAIDSIIRIGKLSNRQAYEFDDNDVRKIVRALKTAIAEVEERFSQPTRRSQSKFSL